MKDERQGKIVQMFWLILLANFAVAAVKIVMGILVNSGSVTADGFHSLTDGASNIVCLIGMRLASRPVDDDHPYGHGKFETLAGMAIAGMLLVISGKIVYGACTRFTSASVPTVSVESLVVLLVTLVINIAVAMIELRRGKKLNSQLLISDSMHTRSDIYVTISVLAGLIAIKLGIPPIIDPILSIVIAVLILHAAYEIFKNASSVLVDAAVVDADKIKELVMRLDKVTDVHHIRSRGTENEQFIDLHIWTDPDMTVSESHALTHEIENLIRQEISASAQVIVHTEPFEVSDAKDEEWD